MRIGRILAVLLLLGAAVAGYLAYSLATRYAGFHGEAFIEFPKGTSTGRMAAMLQDAGVIRHSWTFLAARALNRQTLQAGEYRFAEPASVLEVYRRIARGDIFYLELVVPEGKNMFDIAEIAAGLGLFPAPQFLKAARNPALIRDLAPHAPTLEGYLFPNTYKVRRHTPPEQVCRMMIAKFREIWKSLNTQADVHRTVTLASLVEKESKLPEERPLIASVYRKRLDLGMKLDCDPTTIYAALLEGRYRGVIHKSDLASPNLYNTYRNPGLPPGPIANPGLKSLEAALHPAESRYLFFVARADGSGGHTFSETLAEHDIAASRYHRALQQ
jgi:UPF0755 protein